MAATEKIFSCQFLYVGNNSLTLSCHISELAPAYKNMNEILFEKNILSVIVAKS